MGERTELRDKRGRARESRRDLRLREIAARLLFLFHRARLKVCRTERTVLQASGHGRRWRRVSPCPRCSFRHDSSSRAARTHDNPPLDISAFARMGSSGTTSSLAVRRKGRWQKEKRGRAPESFETAARRYIAQPELIWPGLRTGGAVAFRRCCYDGAPFTAPQGRPTASPRDRPHRCSGTVRPMHPSPLIRATLPLGLVLLVGATGLHYAESICWRSREYWSWRTKTGIQPSPSKSSRVRRTRKRPLKKRGRRAASEHPILRRPPS